jgi:spermidine synthase
MLKLILGNTTYATSITVAVFLGGLALGAALVRNRADALRNRIRTYAFIELGISVFALLVPFFLRTVDSFYVLIYRNVAPSPPLILLLQIVFSTLILLIPSTMMGTTLPILSGWLVKRADLAGHKAGILYAFNTFGAFTGTFVSGFYLIRIIGIYPTMYIAVGLNFILAGAALYVSRLKEKQGTKEKVPEMKRGYTIPLKKKFTFPAFTVNFWLFTGGFAALGFEILWVRTIVHFLQAEIYVFSSILCVYLIGYALGVYGGSWLVRKVSNHFMVYGFMIQVLGFFGILYIPALILLYRTHTVQFLPVTLFLMKQNGIFLPLFYCTILFLLPSICMGIGYPLLIQMKRRFSSSTGNTVARAYSITTSGNVLGSLATGFIFIPAMGSQASMYLLGGVCFLAGLLAIPFITHPYRRYLSVLLCTGGLIFIVTYPRNELLKWINTCEGKNINPTKLLEVVEGINTTASVHYYENMKGKVISTAGINVAGDMMMLRQTQKVQGHLPVIFHGDPQKVLTVGFGSGELTRLLTLHEIPDITCVEISPEMVELAKRHFSHLNLGDELEAKVRMIYMDAKNYLHLTDSTYDIIMNDSIWPGWFADSSSLYTLEYFMEGKRLLNSDGLYSTWLPVNLPALSLKSILKTFDEVFENTIVIYPHYTGSQHMLLIGQKKNHKYSYRKMKDEYEKNEHIQKSLQLIGIRHINDVIDFVFTSSSSVTNFTGDTPLNTDYFPVVEFDPERHRERYNPVFHWIQLRSLFFNTERIDYTDLLSFEGLDHTEQENVLDELRKSQKANTYLFGAIFSPVFKQKMQLLEQGLRIDPGNPDLLSWKRLILAKERMKNR